MQELMALRRVAEEAMHEKQMIQDEHQRVIALWQRKIEEKAEEIDRIQQQV
jgi:hypothetical protein